MNKRERERKLDMLYNTGSSEEYIALLTEDFTEYDWQRTYELLNTPHYNEFTGEMEPSYREKYRKEY